MRCDAWARRCVRFFSTGVAALTRGRLGSMRAVDRRQHLDRFSAASAPSARFPGPRQGNARACHPLPFLSGLAPLIPRNPELGDGAASATAGGINVGLPGHRADKCNERTGVKPDLQGFCRRQAQPRLQRRRFGNLQGRLHVRRPVGIWRAMTATPPDQSSKDLSPSRSWSGL